jgi:hypothetical protein
MDLFRDGVQDAQDDAYAWMLDGQFTEAQIIENLSCMIVDAHDGCPLEWRMGWICGFAQEVTNHAA